MLEESDSTPVLSQDIVKILTSPADISEVICDHVNMVSVSVVFCVIIVTITTVSTVSANITECGQSDLLKYHDIRQSAPADFVTAVCMKIALLSLYCNILADMGNVMLCTRERSVSQLPTSSAD